MVTRRQDHPLRKGTKRGGGGRRGKRRIKSAINIIIQLNRGGGIIIYICKSVSEILFGHRIQTRDLAEALSTFQLQIQSIRQTREAERILHREFKTNVAIPGKHSGYDETLYEKRIDTIRAKGSFDVTLRASLYNLAVLKNYCNITTLNITL